MAKGFPDLSAMWSNGHRAATLAGMAFLELKDRGGSLAPEQIDWLNWLHQAGFPCGCFRSVESACNFLRRHGAPFMMAGAA
jgi:hypothetical protein